MNLQLTGRTNSLPRILHQHRQRPTHRAQERSRDSVVGIRRCSGHARADRSASLRPLVSPPPKISFWSKSDFCVFVVVVVGHMIMAQLTSGGTSSQRRRRARRSSSPPPRDVRRFPFLSPILPSHPPILPSRNYNSTPLWHGQPSAPSSSNSRNRPV